MSGKSATNAMVNTLRSPGASTNRSSVHNDNRRDTFYTASEGLNHDDDDEFEDAVDGEECAHPHIPVNADRETPTEVVSIGRMSQGAVASG